MICTYVTLSPPDLASLPNASITARCSHPAHSPICATFLRVRTLTGLPNELPRQIIIHESAPSTKTRSPPHHLMIYAYLQSKTERVDFFLSNPHSDQFEFESNTSSPHSDADGIHDWSENPTPSPSSHIASRSTLWARIISTCSVRPGPWSPRGVSGLESPSEAQSG